MKAYTKEWTVSGNEGLTIKEFLKGEGISKSALAFVKFHGGEIIVNEVERTVRYILQKGDRLKVTFPPEVPSGGLKPENIPLTIVYEDEHVLVVNKPARMNTIPSKEHPTGSLANALLFYYEKIGLPSTVHIVTRLDRDTSGLVLIAKHQFVHGKLSLLQQQKKVNREYEALSEGTFKEPYGKIELPIGRKDTSIIEREVRHDGKYACTYYRVLQNFQKFSHVKLKLETGRTHQIRVHLSHIGHPLVGDTLYGGGTKWLKRQALHCSSLSFFHPFLKEELHLKCQLPKDIEKLVKNGSE
ncbi:pseudouridine synthase [Bacillus coahuilensis m2-6]|uniref:RluA family pseudouridine synthase n=1 Tax=Bacillus coahuilensis TaxID=408580 RepID=UPI0007505A99|nr:RluA family pseudouridine synthase [Bacillus coahuilensis]KUP09001.1 pseudouridine synthase [Bacillus coahuilensis m2-6]